MNWKDAAEQVVKYAPAIASALGGPAAGGIAAGASSMVSGLLGVEDSPAGLVAATQDPEKRKELIRLNNEHRERFERMRLEAEAAEAAEKTARLAETQKTIRAELKHEGWFKSGWRPATGWVFAASVGGFVAVMAYSLTQDPSMIGDPDFVAMVAWVFGTMGAALGINIRERSKDKARQVGAEPSSFMDRIRR